MHSHIHWISNWQVCTLYTGVTLGLENLSEDSDQVPVFTVFYNQVEGTYTEISSASRVWSVFGWRNVRRRKITADWGGWLKRVSVQQKLLIGDGGWAEPKRSPRSLPGKGTSTGEHKEVWEIRVCSEIPRTSGGLWTGVGGRVSSVVPPGTWQKTGCKHTPERDHERPSMPG